VRQIEEWTAKLAELAIFGANVQPGQLVAVTSYIGKEDITRAVTHAAYQRGARYVDILYFDQWLKRERILHAAEDSLDYIPPWLSDRLLWLSEEHAARITLSGPHAPDALVGVDPGRAGRDLLPYLPQVGEVVNRRTTNWSFPISSPKTRTAACGSTSRTSAASTPRMRLRPGQTASPTSRRTPRA
jgi:aminopeptidase